MVYFQKLEDSSYKALKIGIGLNILSVIDMIWLTYFINSTVWIATGMNFYRLLIFLKIVIDFENLIHDLKAISAQNFLLLMYFNEFSFF